jgi:hypothetical protein
MTAGSPDVGPPAADRSGLAMSLAGSAGGLVVVAAVMIAVLLFAIVGAVRSGPSARPRLLP